MKIPIALNSKSAQNLVKELEKIFQEIDENEEKKINEINSLLDEAYEYAITMLSDLSLYADTDMTSVVDKLSIEYYDEKTHRGSLVLRGGKDTENVGLFVEFGTGVKGQENPHPAVSNGDVTWQYDQNAHGSKGWWYETSEDDFRNPIKWRDKEGILRAWTKGMPSRPFMYDTMLWLKEQVGDKYKVGFEFKGETK